MAFRPVAAPRADADSSLLFWRPGNEPRGQHSKLAETGDYAKGAEHGEYRSGRRQQDCCARTHDRGQHLLSRGQAGSLRRVFAAALWSADYSLLLASNDYLGVNLHGGTGKSVANSVGGSLPGDALLEANGETPQQIAAHPHPFYTPIATFGSDYTLEPVAYGLKFAGSFSGGTLLKTEFSAKLQAAGVNATAYAAKLPTGQTSVIILNKDAGTDLEVELDFGRDVSGAVETEILHAPALDSREAHITTSTKTDSLQHGKCSVIISRATGLRLTVI